ncbi:hypothetical protein OAT18_03035 [Tenacibaculum sp.]|nr:hypothetical protein [Tenacibaculum sp.]
MKKIIILLLTVITLSSCLNDDTPKYQHKILSIDEVLTPTSFTFGHTDTITVKYTLPNSCHHFRSLYYQYKDTTRIVAINIVENLEISCAQATIEKELKFPVKATQKEDYLFKFWKGKDQSGKDTFTEVIIPVND